MRKSKLMYRSQSPFFYVKRIPGVCSSITLHGINSTKLKKMSRDEVVYHVEKAIKELPESEKINLDKVKTIQISLNVNRFWSWFTPWKFAYCYKGNSDKPCFVFYMNFNDPE